MARVGYTFVTHSKSEKIVRIGSTISAKPTQGNAQRIGPKDNKLTLVLQGDFVLLLRMTFRTHALPGDDCYKDDALELLQEIMTDSTVRTRVRTFEGFDGSIAGFKVFDDRLAGKNKLPSIYARKDEKDTIIPAFELERSLTHGHLSFSNWAKAILIEYSSRVLQDGNS